MFSLFGTAAPNATAAWHREPEVRGTYGILSSCVITLALSIWTAVHLNLPEHGKENLHTWRKTKWLFVALLAPEVIAWIAFRQRREAILVRDSVRKSLGQSVISQKWRKTASTLLRRRRESTIDISDDEKIDRSQSSLPKRHEWTMIHGHFAAMGGFAFDTSDDDVNIFPGGRTRVTLTSIGVCLLAELAPELLPNLSPEQILDKSKSDGFGKAIACIQAFWFCIQCVSRLSAGLSVSLLELNTFAHALCALLCYMLWWNKPHDVHHPLTIQGSSMHQLAAAMVMRSSIGAIHEGSSFIKGEDGQCRIWEESEGFATAWDFGLVEAMMIHKRPDILRARPTYPPFPVDISEGPHLRCALEDYPKSTVHPDQTVRLYMGQSLFGFVLRRTRLGAELVFDPIESIGILSYQRPFVDLTKSDILRWRLAQQGLQNYPALLSYKTGFTLLSGQLATKYIHLKHRTECCTFRVLNFPNLDMLKQNFTFAKQPTRTLLLTLMVSGLFYGLLHIAAWNAPFRSHVEQLLWRISSLTLAISGFIPLVVWALLVIVVYLNDNVVKRLRRKMGGFKIPDFLKIPMVFVLFCLVSLIIAGGALIYVFSRVYLLVECFLALPYLPPSTLKMPLWSQYFIHLS